MDGCRVFDGDVRIVLVNSGFINGEFCPSLYNHHGALNIIRATRTEVCVRHEQMAYAGQEFGAQKKLLNSFVFIRGKSDEKKEGRARKFFLLSRCLMGEESESDELAFVRYAECEPPMEKVYKALRFLRLQWATAGSTEEDQNM